MVRVEINEETADIQTRSFTSRTLDEIGKNAKLKEKQKWPNERFHLETARRLRGIYFIDPEDTEFKETTKNARKKLETTMAPAMPCETIENSQHGVTRGKSNEIKSKLARIFINQ